MPVVEGKQIIRDGVVVFNKMCEEDEEADDEKHE